MGVCEPNYTLADGSLIHLINRRMMHTNWRRKFLSFCCNAQLCTLFISSVTLCFYLKTVINPQGKFGAKNTQNLKILSHYQLFISCLHLHC